MVVAHNIKDILNNLPQSGSFSLPALKQNPLKIEYTKEDVSNLLFNLLKYV